MNCLKPILVNNPRYGKNNKEPTKIFVPCGKCEVCRDNESKSWRFRLNEENRVSTNALFVTLTYNDGSLPFGFVSLDNGECKYFPIVVKKHVQDFFKRLRSHFEDKGIHQKIRYFAVSEYGPNTLRPHYHIILFNFPLLRGFDIVSLSKATKIIQKCWDIGFVKVDIVNEQRLNYVTKYVCNTTVLPEYLKLKEYKPFRLISKGLGKSYLDREERVLWHRMNPTKLLKENGFNVTIPRYIKQKLYDDSMLEEQREAYLNYCFSRFNDYVKKATTLGYSGNEYQKFYKICELERENFLRKYERNNIKKRIDL